MASSAFGAVLIFCSRNPVSELAPRKFPFSLVGVHTGHEDLHSLQGGLADVVLVSNLLEYAEGDVWVELDEGKVSRSGFLRCKFQVSLYPADRTTPASEKVPDGNAGLSSNERLRVYIEQNYLPSLRLERHRYQTGQLKQPPTTFVITAPSVVGS